MNYVRFLICTYSPIEFQMTKKGRAAQCTTILYECALCLMRTAFTNCLMAAVLFLAVHDDIVSRSGLCLARLVHQ